MTFRDADRRPHVCRFHKYWKFEFACDLLNDSFLITFDFFPVEKERIYHWNAICFHDILEHTLIHSNCRTQDSSTHIGYFCHLEKSLQRSIFPICPMNDWKDNIQFSDQFNPAAGEYKKTSFHWVG